MHVVDPTGDVVQLVCDAGQRFAQFAHRLLQIGVLAAVSVSVHTAPSVRPVGTPDMPG